MDGLIGWSLQRSFSSGRAPAPGRRPSSSRAPGLGRPVALDVTASQPTDGDLVRSVAQALTALNNHVMISLFQMRVGENC